MARAVEYFTIYRLDVLRRNVCHWVVGTTVTLWVSTFSRAFPIHLVWPGLSSRASLPQLCRVWEGCDMISCGEFSSCGLPTLWRCIFCYRLLFMLILVTIFIHAQLPSTSVFVDHLIFFFFGYTNTLFDASHYVICLLCTCLIIHNLMMLLLVLWVTDPLPLSQRLGNLWGAATRVSKAGYRRPRVRPFEPCTREPRDYPWT